MKTLKKAIAKYKTDSKINEWEWRRATNFSKYNLNKERFLVRVIIDKYGVPDDCIGLNETAMAKKLSIEISPKKSNV